MQGADINSSNTAAYGDGVAGGVARGFLTNANFVAGLYEYATVTSVVGSTIGLAGAGANGGLLNTYRNAAATSTVGQFRFQVIRVPQYASAVMNVTTPPTVSPWNGTTGGVLVVDVAATLDLNAATLDVSGLGFKGGAQRVHAGASGLSNTDYRTATASAANGQKGEGIAGRPVWQTGDPDSVGNGYPNGDFARGAPGNAGGGGTDGNPATNDQNSGGGGGGNGGVGGRGGNTWSSNLAVGGFGGSTVPGSVTRAFLGGGGGAGSDNNNVLSSAGGAGGGAVLIRAGSLSGTGTINADGADGDTSGQDGAGGAGAGGTVVVLTSAAGAASGFAGLTINARGGDGGDETNASPHGPGGGGGGGQIVTSAAPSSTDVAGGANGLHAVGAYGATPGAAGSVGTAPIASSPGTNTGSQCIDAQVTKSIAPAIVVPGQPVTYTVTVTNAGPYPATGTAPISVTDPLPADLISPTWTCTASAGSSCGAASGAGSLATTANLVVGGTATYIIAGTLSPTFAGTLSNTATVAGPASVPELNPADNTATVDATEAPLDIDKQSDATGPVFPGDVITYTLDIDNNGPVDLTGVSVTDVLPAGLTYVPASTTVSGDRRESVTEDFEGGAAGWTASGSCATGDWIAANPVSTTYQVGSDHTPGGTQALITAQNPGGADGTDDVDGGSCTITSTNYPVSGGGDLSIWYSFGQRDTGDDPNDGFLLEASFNGGTTWNTMVQFGDVARAKGWTLDSIVVPPSATNVVVRATATDGPGPGDIIEGALDDFAMTTIITGPFDNAPGGDPDLADGTPPNLVTAAENFFIPAGGTITVTYQATVDAGATGTLTNVATANSNESGPATDSESVVVGVASLDLTKTQTSGPNPVGGVPATLGYTITVVNDGNVTLTDVTLTDTLPDGSAGSPVGPTETLTPDGIFEAGETWTYTVSYPVTQDDVDAGADLTNVAAVTAERPGGDPGDPGDDITDTDSAVTPVSATSTLGIDKPAPVLSTDADASGDISAGDTLTYTVTATNTGTASLTNVVVSDGLITPTGGSTPCGLVAPAGTCTLIGTYVVTTADVTAGQIDNTATADSDQTGQVTDSETVLLPSPVLVVDKPAPLNADEDGSGDVSVGDTLTYSITATNTGTANLTDVIVSDPLITPTGGSTPCGLVAPAGTCTLIGTYVVTAADVTAGQIVNTATAESDQTAPVTDDETVTVPTPALGVVKPAPVNADEDGSGDVSVGDTLTYSITATNTGTANLTDVVVSDPLITPTVGSTPCALVVPAGTCTLVGTYVVTAADVTAGQIVNTATADSDQTAPVTDDETVTVPTPALVVDKPAPANADEDGSGDVSAGDTLTYTITATNTGTANLTDVVLSDPLVTPTGGTTPCGLVVPGGTCTLVGTYVVTAADVTAGQIDNTATADSDQTSPVTDDETVTVPAPALAVDKPAPANADEDGSGDVSVGDTLTYTITAINTGASTLTNLVVSDSLITPTGGSTPCVVVAPGGSCTLVGTYVVTAADVTAGSIVNTGTADSDQTPPVTDGETVVVPTPALGVAKPAPVNADEDGSGDVSVGDTLTYTITATNTGGANLTNVVVSDPLVTPTGGTAPCGLVAPAGTCTLVGTYVVTAADVTAGQIDNTATADSDQTAPVTDDETVLVPTPALVVDKPAPANADEDGSGDVSVGDTLTYTITATNTGAANLTDVVVSDPLVAPTGGTTPCALLLPGESCTLVGTYVVTVADVTAGQIDNTATADSDQTSPVTDDETVLVPAPALAVDKPAPANADQDGSGDVSVGDTLTYTITATNTGAANLTDVVVSDPLVTPTGGTTPCGLVAPAESCTLVGTSVVTAADVTAGQIVNTATADSDQTAPVTDDETVTVPAPALAVDKPAPANADEDGSGDVSVGDTLTYTITATNTGAANLTDVVVSDPLVTPTGGSTPCALLLPAESCTLVGTYVVTAADVTAGQIVNTGTADSDQTAPVTDDETVTVPSPVLGVDKPAPGNADEDGSGDVSVGDTLTYTITATNTGGANLTNVVVSDPLVTPTGGSTPCGLVAPGGSCTLVGTYVVTAADVTAGQIDNTGTADSDQTVPVTDDETVVVPSPGLVVDKPAPVNADEDGSGDVSVGDTLTYTITATNTGGANLTNVVVSDPLVTPTGGSTPCGLVAPGGSCTLVGTYVVTAADVTAGQIVNTATADSDQTVPVTDDETVVVPSPGLVVDKPAPVNADEDGSGDVSVGDTLTYTITATNTGGANLTNVVVSDPLVTPTGGSTPCGLVAPAGTCTLVGTYVVTAADVTAGQIDNTATADSDQTAPVTDDQTVVVPAPDLAVDKPAPTNADEDGSGDVSVGDTLTYTITATNNGGSALTNVVLTDGLITPTGGTTPCLVVLPGGTCTLVGTYVVAEADVTAGSIVNTATADSDQTPPVTDDNTVVAPTPTVSIVKPAPVNADEDGSGDVSVGDTLTYTITATNTGGANLTNVVVSDPLITPTGGSTPCGLVAPGGSCTLVGTYVVTAADVTAGQIVNTATADSDQTVPVADDETTSVPSPALTVDKPAPTNADEDGSGDVSVGDTLTYTITATNSGTANLTNVVVTDDLITPTGGTSPCGLVAPGGTCTLVGTYVVTVADVTAGSIVNTATADSDQTPPTTDDETTPVPTPSLGVDKPAPVNADEDGSGDVSVGDTLTYSITATNTGTANLTNVVVSDPLITPTGGSTPCGLVAPGGSCTLVGTYVVTAAEVTAGQIDNTGTADSDQTAPVTDDETVSVPSPALAVDKPAPAFSIDADSSGDISAGDTLTYTITATNTGTANLTSVVVSDPLVTPTGGTTPCGLVAPGGTCTLVGTYVVTAADVTAGQVVNTGTADSDQTAPVTDDETVALPSPVLGVDKPAPTNADEDGSGDLSVGDTLTYTVTATNTGTANLTGVVVSDPLITPTGGTTPCGLVAPGGTCTLVGTYVVTVADVTAGSIVNSATADSDQTPPTTDDETTSVPSPSLGVDKPAPTNADEDGSGDVSVGDTLTYTITATNSGTANLTNVVVTDDLITPTGGSTPCALLLPTESCTLVGTYVVTAADVTAGQIDNTGTAVSDQTAPVADDETVTVPSPALTVDKPAPTNADEDGSGDVSVGDTLTYTITATNSGTANLTNVVVTDDLITPTGGTTPCALVAPGGTCTLLGTYVVTAADVTAGQIVNTATADSDQTPAVTDDEITPIPLPTLTVDKPAPTNADEDGSGDVSVGDTLTYTITATNGGTATLTNVVVTDDLITSTGGTSPCGIVLPGGTCTLVGTYVVTAADVTAGSIVNTATADSDQTPPVTDDETTSVPTPTLTVDKPAPVNADEDASGDISAGDTLTYTITATNTGTANLTDVVVSDDLITPTGGTTPCGLVAPGGTCTLVGTYVVTAADVTAGQIVEHGYGRFRSDRSRDR